MRAPDVLEKNPDGRRLRRTDPAEQGILARGQGRWERVSLDGWMSEAATPPAQNQKKNLNTLRTPETLRTLRTLKTLNSREDWGLGFSRACWVCRSGNLGCRDLEFRV